MQNKTIIRSGYYRKSYTNKNGTRIKRTYIPPTIIKDIGKVGKGLKLLPQLKKGKLTKFGYHFNESVSKRHIALYKSIKEYGFIPVKRMLIAQRTFRKYSYPTLYKIINSDIKWIQNIH